MAAQGYAVCDQRGEIIVCTVSETARAAKINWLVVYGHVAVLNDWSDGMVDAAFEELAFNTERVVSVTIAELQ